MEKLWIWAKNPGNRFWFVYAGLSLIVLFPLLAPGYILTLDLVFTPHIQWPHDLTSTFPVRVIVWGLGQLLPGDVIEKLVLFVILFCSGISTHMLVISFKRTIYADTTWQLGAFVAGVFYMINPFTYSRFMAGQWMVLLGYALFPFFIRMLLELMEKPSMKKALMLGVMAAVVMAASIHFSGMIAVTAVVAWLLIAGKRRAAIRYYAVSLATTIVLTCYWWIPALVGKSDLGVAVAGFNDVHFDAFRTTSHGAFGAIGEVLRLQGFWVEARGFYLLPQDWVPAWGLLFMGFWALVVVGAVKFWRIAPLLVRLCVICIVIGVILAATPLIQWSSQYVPFAAGYREPHKFAALVALGYAVLAAFGAMVVAQKTKKQRQRTAVWGVLIVLPIILTPTMLWGFGGQLQPRHYPIEWYEANELLKREVAGSEKVLVLPWHQYSEYRFTQRIIANPAEVFFEVPTVVSDDPEFKQVSPTTPNDAKRKIEAALRNKSSLVDVLMQQNIHVVVLLKEQDFGDYAYLDDERNLKKIQENDMLSIYRLEER